ncbi:rhamnulokinase [Parafrigoribacterium soli]|uniref:rhamnulokinase n=1 Tax=Parafrigoribacterium soli TaxID=3144663 RepID=UPI0032EFA911
MTSAVAAVDLGATSGRVMLGYVGHNELSLRPVARFPNGPVTALDGLHWNITGLYRQVIGGLASTLREEPGVLSIGVDSWAVDYALLSGGRMLAEPFHYRDERTAAAVASVHGVVSPTELYARNGLQFLPFNTLYQLTADRLSGRLGDVDEFLLVPDLLNLWLTGEHRAERSNASTTGLLNLATGDWDDELVARLGLPRAMFPALTGAGVTVGGLLPGVAVEIGAGLAVSVTAVGSHDTASAVVAIPATTDDFAYISCGTWGLVGVELDEPVLTEESRLANFTNEGGVDGRMRFLHNVMGLWLLSESVRAWEREDAPIDLGALLGAAAAVTSTVPLFDANDERFLAPGDMPTRIAQWLTERGLPVPQSRAEFVRCILESLADAFATAVHTASELSGKRVSVIHLVGGGSQNELLCQLTANRSGLVVLAGPVEATAIGNVLVQARAQGAVRGDLETLRALVAAAFRPVAFTPQPAR